AVLDELGGDEGEGLVHVGAAARRALVHLGVHQAVRALDLAVAAVERHHVPVAAQRVAPVAALAQVGLAVEPLGVLVPPPALDELGLGEGAEDRARAGVELPLDLVGRLGDGCHLGAALAVCPGRHARPSSISATTSSRRSSRSLTVALKRSSHRTTCSRAAPSTLYQRHLPAGRTRTSPASRRTARCFDTCGWEMARRATSWLTVASSGPRAARMSRRTGSERAARAAPGVGVLAMPASYSQSGIRQGAPHTLGSRPGG